MAGTARRPLRVASVPRGHVYVDHLSPPTDDGEAAGVDRVVRLRDPTPQVVDPAPGQWWPPVMLEPRWIREHADDFDVFHLHFGFDALAAATLARTVEELRAVRRPLVYTVHDLRNPHHATRGLHDEHLDVLIPAADQLITLTAGAAAEIERRWGRRAVVVPHPHVVPLAWMARARTRAPGGRFRVGLHLKSVRASMAPREVVLALLPLTEELARLDLVVDLHRDVADPDGVRHDPALMSLLRAAERTGAIELHVHDCYTDDELWAYLEALDLSVLPYRFGTHSGWVEACRDLGTPVLAPSCGYLAEQNPGLIYQHDESGLDGESLRDGVRSAYRTPVRTRPDVARRRHERTEIAEQHRRVYAAALG